VARIQRRELVAHSIGIALPLIWCLAALACFTLAFGAGSRVVALVALIGVAWLSLVRVAPGIGLGVWALAVADMIPGVNLGNLAVSGRFQPLDALIALFVVAACLGARDRRRSLRVPKWLWIALAAQLLWWSFTLARTCLLHHEPFMPSLLFGRDLLYMVTVAVCAPAVLRSHDELAKAMAALIVGGVVYSVAFLVQILLHVDMHLFVHSSAENMIVGLRRVYATGNNLISALLPVVLWTALVGSRKWRWGSVALFLLFAAQVVFRLGRANYIGVAFGIVAVWALVLFARPRPHAGTRKRLLAGTFASVLIVACAAGILVTLTALSGADTTADEGDDSAQSISTRVASMTDIFTGTDRTTAYRLVVAGDMRELLHGNWIEGLGFVHPQRAEFPELPGSNLRNVDVGALGIVMVMGIIGLLTTLIPPIGVAVTATRAISKGVRVVNLPIAAGLLAFLLGGLITSVTLVLFFSARSSALAGALLGIALFASQNAQLTPRQPLILQAG
jgi:hypothetical protein